MVTPLEEGAIVDGHRVRALLFRAAAFDAYSAIDTRGTAVCLLHRAHGRRELPRADAFAADLEKLKALNSKWLPRVLSGGRDDSASWVVTEAIGGTAPIWAPGAEPVPWLRVVTASRRVADALRSAAQVNLYHGSLEPQCIRKWQHGRIWVVGVSVARLFGLDLDTVHESPRYFAPEQVLGSPIPTSASADIYALGMCLHGALLGREPFEGATNLQLLDLVQHGSPGIVVSPAIPFQVWEWIARSVAKEPRERLDGWDKSIAMCGMVLAICADQADENVLAELLMEGVEDMGPDTRRGLEAWIERGKRPDSTPEEASAEERASGPAHDHEVETPRSPEGSIESDSSPREPAPTADSSPAEGPTTQRVPAFLPVEGPPANDVRWPRSRSFQAPLPEPALNDRAERARAWPRRGGAAMLASVLVCLVFMGALLVWTGRASALVLANHLSDLMPSLLEAASKTVECAGTRHPDTGRAEPYFTGAARRPRPIAYNDKGKASGEWSKACGEIFNCKRMPPCK
jgi:serine/threonine protein kinase